MKWWLIVLIVWFAVNGLYLYGAYGNWKRRERLGMKYNEWADEWYIPEENDDGTEEDDDVGV